MAPFDREGESEAVSHALDWADLSEPEFRVITEEP